MVIKFSWQDLDLNGSLLAGLPKAATLGLKAFLVVKVVSSNSYKEQIKNAKALEFMKDVIHLPRPKKPYSILKKLF